MGSSSPLSFMMDFPVVFMKPPMLWTKDRLFCASWLRTVTRPHIRSLFKLCQEHQIPLLTVPDNMQLGKYAGLCKLDAEGNERKVVRCSSVVVRDWGKEGPALDFLKEHIKQQRA